LILTILNDSKGKWFGNNGDRYEGEWEDGQKNGQGMKKLFTLWLILTVFDDYTGKYFWKDGNRYEGEWKDDKKLGQGKKEEIYFVVY